jgi:hypothetical protein
MQEKVNFMFNILITEEDGLYIAHCLELDIVATAATEAQVKQDMIDLIKAQITYAFEHNNFAYLYHPAPPEVWEQFFTCQENIQECFQIQPAPGERHQVSTFLASAFITNTAMVAQHA